MIVSVTQLNNYIRGVFEVDGLLNDVSVCGEITNLKRAANGWYFSLKDDCGAINCFSYFGNFEPIAGAQVVVDGQVNYFTRTGSVSLFARRVSVSNNLGAAYLQFVQLKEKLQKEGLFDESRKKAVPHCCSKIGVVTSETGAVIHDIKNVVLRRQPFSEIILYPVKVQGEGADCEIALGVKFFSDSDVDAVIVGRGGGSNEDLSAFNSETVVRAVSECKKPVVSAVGHGVDFTLCDFAADKRAVTPSEAAEFLTVDGQSVKKSIIGLLSKSSGVLQERIKNFQNYVVAGSKLIQSTAVKKSELLRAQVVRLLADVSSRSAAIAAKTELKLNNSTEKLKALNPANVLNRGYARVVSDGEPVSSVDKISVGASVNIILRDGNFSAVVTGKEKK